MSNAPMFNPATAAEQPAEAKIGAMGRIFGVLTSPTETFADIARKPTWIAPVALSMVLGIAFAFVMNQRIDWYSYIKQQIEKSPRASNMSAEQITQAARMQSRFSPPFAYGIGVLAPPLAGLFMALVFWGAFNMLGGAGARFGQAFGVVTHSFMTGLVSSPITMLVMFLKQKGDVDPETMLASHAGAFLSSDAPRWMFSLASSFELFWFWTMFLMAVGFTAINRKKLTVGKSMGIILGVWLVWVALKTGLSYAFN